MRPVCLLTAAAMLVTAALTTTAAHSAGPPAAAAQPAARSASVAQPAETYNPALGSGSELFIDNYRVAATSGMQRIVHPGTKSGVLLQGDKPWDSGTTYLYGTVLHDGGTYKMWYTALGSQHHSIAYATSTNGTSWTKPSLHLVSFQGSTDNNIVVDNVDLTGGVIHDPSASDPNRRYKMMTYHTGPTGYYVYFSPDGLRWTQYGSTPVIANGDVANVSADPAHHRFIAMTKQPDGQRAAFYSTSTDFINWTTPKLSLEADATDDAESPVHDTQIYGMPAMPYGNAYIGFPWIFPITAENSGGGTQDGTVYPQIAVSRDLATWGRLMRTPVISLGAAGSFDDGMIYTTNNIITDDKSNPGTVIMYYSGWNGTHHAAVRSAKIARVTWRTDGFVSLSNRDSGAATMTTKAVTFTGGSLHVNANLRSGGSLWVEARTAAGQPISGFGHSDTLTGDQLDATVSWPGASLSSLASQDVTFVFHQTNGDLYSFGVH